jgi:uncharacterized protein (TIGR00369 family)
MLTTSGSSVSEALAPNEAQALLTRLQTIPAFNGLGIQQVVFKPGFCQAVVPRQPQLDGIFESYHGGMLATAADTIACFAIMTQTGPDSWLTTTDLNIRFLNACLTSVRVEAQVIKLGRQLCPVAVNLFDDNNTLVAVAQVTYMRLNGAPKR